MGEFYMVETDSALWKQHKTAYLAGLENPNTRRAYTAAISKLEEWTANHNTCAEHISSFDAKRYFDYLSSRKLAFASIKRDIAALSVFYVYMQKQSMVIYNPFDKITPQLEAMPERETIIPTAEEIAAVIRHVPPVEKAVIACIATRGFSSSSLPTLKRNGGYYQATYKGKPITDGNTPDFALPEIALDFIKDAGLNADQPFVEYSATAIERRVLNHVGKVFQNSQIRAVYSCRDFRNFFAANEYTKTKDIYRLSKHLGHTSLQSTQSFLWRLGFNA